MRITLTSVHVNDQDKALKFYTEKLGFIKKMDIPVGEYKWLTVVSPEDPDGTQLVLEPEGSPDMKPFTLSFKEAAFKQGIPLAAFQVSDINAEYERLKNLGVEFTMPPTNAGPATIAILNDTCGNLIQIFQV